MRAALAGPLAVATTARQPRLRLGAAWRRRPAAGPRTLGASVAKAERGGLAPPAVLGAAVRLRLRPGRPVGSSARPPSAREVLKPCPRFFSDLGAGAEPLQRLVGVRRRIVGSRAVSL
jgi:hypothetical protein